MVPSARYRVDHQLSGGSIETWSGLDETLHRPVTIRIADLDTEAGQRLRLQARALARLEHPGLLHVLDTSSDDERFAVITEALPPSHLGEELHARGHLRAGEALDIVVEVGDALAALHRAGFAHGGVAPSSIGRRENQRFVILDGPPTSDAVVIPATPNGDLRSLAILLHVLVIGHPPLVSPGGHHDLHPAIPAVLAPLLSRALDDGDPWPDTTAFVLALRDALPHVPTEDDEDDSAASGSFLRAERAWFAPVGVLLIIAAVILTVGIIVARTPAGQSIIDNAKEVVGFDTTTTLPATSPSTIVPPRTTAPSAELAIIDITDFDPSGDDRTEHPERLNLINDGDPDAGWYTERYTTREFGNLKDGVGLIIALGPPQQLDRLELGSPTLGWSVEIYIADESAGNVIDWGEPVARARDVRGAADFEFDEATAATVLVWITDLGDELSTGGHRATITDVTVQGRPLFG